MRHYQIPELDQYRNHKMPFFARLICRWHLAKCNRCRARLNQLGTDDLFLQDVKESLKKLDIPENEVAYRRLCDTFQEKPEQHSSV